MPVSGRPDFGRWLYCALLPSLSFGACIRSRIGKGEQRESLALPPLPGIEAVFSSRKSGLAVLAMSRCRYAKARPARRTHARRSGRDTQYVEAAWAAWRLIGSTDRSQ